LASDPSAKHDPYAALRYRNVRLYLAGNLLSILGVQMQSITVGWEITQRTHNPLMLGYVGLAQVIPVLALALPAGHVADRFDRKTVITLAVSLILLSSVGLAITSLLTGPIWLMYVWLFLNGVARAFQQPAKSSFFPELVPRETFANAVTWNMGGFQIASVVGPALGGLLIWLSDIYAIVYLLDALAALVFILLLTQVTRPERTVPIEPPTLANMVVGAQFVWSNKVILGAMTLDMFAVLLGGAVSLEPIFADEILKVGSEGFGLMRASTAVGALVMSLCLAHRPPFSKAGPVLLFSVAVFGAVTIVFGLSKSFPLTLIALFLLGVFDMVSVVIRHTLVQLLTPDSMRGRVSAVNSMFISASNELGGFESGALAALIGPVSAVVWGGIGTIVVVLLVAIGFPQLRRYGKLGSASEG
jgi:MFS family permease